MSQPTSLDGHWIVPVSSITGVRVGYAGLSHYSATKAGMLGFMRTVALGGQTLPEIPA